MPPLKLHAHLVYHLPDITKPIYDAIDDLFSNLVSPADAPFAVRVESELLEESVDFNFFGDEGERDDLGVAGLKRKSGGKKSTLGWGWEGIDEGDEMVFE
jgi:hypothetical protein